MAFYFYTIKYMLKVQYQIPYKGFSLNTELSIEMKELNLDMLTEGGLECTQFP